MSKPLPLPGFESLHDRLLYDPISGDLRWKRRPLAEFSDEAKGRSWNTRYAGTSAGWIQVNGYRMVTLFEGRFLAHRLIWKMMTGEDPVHEIDHVNGIPLDTRWANLRAATPSENIRNRRTQSNSRTGFKGVRMLPGGRFAAYIGRNRKFVHLGCFDTAEEAHRAYCDAARMSYGAFFNPG